MAHRIMPPQQFLREAFSYDQESGEIFWLWRPVRHFANALSCKKWNRKFAGRNAGTVLDAFGYVRIRLGPENLVAHRAIWKWMTGKDPIGLDHIDRNPNNNKWNNLREASQSDNCSNRSVVKKKEIPLKGVTISGKRFMSAIQSKGVRRHLGTFDTAEEAHAAYCEAAKEMNGEFWCGG